MDGSEALFTAVIVAAMATYIQSASYPKSKCSTLTFLPPLYVLAKGETRGRHKPFATSVPWRMGRDLGNGPFLPSIPTKCSEPV